MTRLHIASGYDPHVYDFTLADFAACGEYAAGFHTYVVTVFHATALDTFAPITGCLVDWDGRSITLRTRAGNVTVIPESVHVLGDACRGHAPMTEVSQDDQ